MGGACGLGANPAPDLHESARAVPAYTQIPPGCAPRLQWGSVVAWSSTAVTTGFVRGQIYRTRAAAGIGSACGPGASPKPSPPPLPPKEATVYQRHRIRQRLATGAWRDFHENKIACLPYLDPSTEYARTLRHLQASDARWRAEKTRAQPHTLPWDAGSGRLSRGAQALWRRPPAPAAQAAGERRGCPDVSALLTARATATHR
jgi:hypothetical protein